MTRVAVGIIRSNGKILACQRRRQGRYPLKWEFPGGKMEPGETVLQCLKRELQEELAINVRTIEKIETQTAHYEDGGMFEVAYCHVSDFEGTPENRAFEQIRWVKPAEFRTLDILEGNAPIISTLSDE